MSGPTNETWQQIHARVGEMLQAFVSLHPAAEEGECSNCGSTHCLYDNAASLNSFCPACAWGACS